MLQETVSAIYEVVDLQLPVVPTYNPALEGTGICCTKLPVFGDLSDPDKLRNDYSEFPWWHIDAIEFKLYKDGVDTGFTPVIRTYQQIKITLSILELSWTDVLDDLGAGEYYIEIEDVGTGGVLWTSFDYNLRPFNEILASTTTRVDYTKNSIVGGEDQKFKYNYIGSEYSNQIRLPFSMVRHDTAPLERETVRLRSGFDRPYQKQFRDRWNLIIRSCPSDVLAFVKFELLQCDTMMVSDFTPDAPCGWRPVCYYVDVDGDFTLKHKTDTDAVVLPLVDAYNNSRKLYS